MQGVLSLRCPYTPKWSLWPPPGSRSAVTSTDTDGAAARGAARRQVLGASLSSCPNRCPGPDRPSDSGRPQGTTSSGDRSHPGPCLPPEEEPHPVWSLYVCSLDPSSQTRYFSFVTSVLRGSHKAPSCHVFPRNRSRPPEGRCMNPRLLPRPSPPSPGPGLRLTGASVSVTVCHSVPPLGCPFLALGP